MKKFIKGNIKLVIGIVLGAILFSGLGAFAATVLNGIDVKYDNNNSKLTSTNVQGAIDEIYNNMVPIDSNTFNTNTSKTVYASSKGVCIKRNDKLNCFRINNYDVEKDHVKQVFSDVSCNVDSSVVNCITSDFNCYVSSDGFVSCYDVSDYSGGCHIDGDGTATCS